MTPHEAHAAGLDIVADELTVVAAQLPDALGDQPLGGLVQSPIADLQSAMGEAAAALAHAVSTSDELGAALRRAAPR
ncbi:hypothetical protein [Actinophytocola algeriensis]|uniref:Excreted virulence factor EspC (Type VII ESX diderm) n=1 Tax=Actinophytocola algeriensis TaxID=1768010 RepID=A0A7W7Q9Z5_9PSEU|nr:hypothetical protein [Actinophytocola algeriensis]MBB4909409.1 hypothetical protein [Actinophytocola algeriensis]MBE1475399.1 hypothetical protein [Actinophytocola algeriensis]